MVEIYAWKCVACGAILDSKLEVLHVHTHGNNGRAYKCEKVGIVIEYKNPPYNTRFTWKQFSSK